MQQRLTNLQKKKKKLGIIIWPAVNVSPSVPLVFCIWQAFSYIRMERNNNLGTAVTTSSLLRVHILLFSQFINFILNERHRLYILNFPVGRVDIELSCWHLGTILETLLMFLLRLVPFRPLSLQQAYVDDYLPAITYRM